MAEANPKILKGTPPELVEVTLKKAHRHRGKLYQPGDKIIIGKHLLPLLIQAGAIDPKGV